MIENSAIRLASNIKKTQKRANALKNITIPKFEALTKDISNALEEKEREEFTRLKVEIQDEVTDEICDVCGRNMVIKYGPHGRFLACPGFPECRNTKPYYEKIGVACPKCGKIYPRRNRRA